MWDSVRRGEERYIFPFQEGADVMFNSALIYELAVLKMYAEPLLFAIDKDCPEYLEAKRLLKFLDYFLPMPSDGISQNSIIREFIASSPTRTIAGLRSFPQKVILIAGGYDKKIPFDVLGQAVQDHVKTLILTGHTADKIRQAVLSSQGYQKGQPTIVMEEDFSQAVLTASRMAEDGDVVLLSPACASFDHFKNFAQRGQTFKAIVNGL